LDQLSHQPDRRPDQRPDRRVQRTREALRDALLCLLPEVGWDDMDVAMLCERANIGRSTFYLHYSDKAALLRGAFADLQQHVLTTIEPSDSDRPYAFLPALLAHVHTQQAVFRALLGRRSSQAVQDHLREVLIALFAPDSASEARTHMLAGSLMQLMVWWLGTAWGLSPEDIEARFLNFAVSASNPPPSPLHQP
jgi:AcrR family transcriptional regulator